MAFPRKRRKMSSGEARQFFDNMYARDEAKKEAAAEAFLKTPAGELARQEFNRKQLVKNPKRRTRKISKRKPRLLSTGKRRVSGVTIRSKKHRARKRSENLYSIAPVKKAVRVLKNPTFGKRKSQKHIIEAVHLKPLKFWYWNGHAVEDKRTHAFIFPTRAAAYAKAKEIRNQLPQGFKALRVIPA